MDKNKVKGMLWGLIVGDAFGSPIQFSGKDDHPWITEMVPCPMFGGLPPGYWTDDGSMAMCVMDSFTRKNGYDLKDIGDTFVKWLTEGYLSSKEGQAFDIGMATHSSVHAIARGSLVNGREDSQGNGSIMRFAPSHLIDRYWRGGHGVTALPFDGGHGVTAPPFDGGHGVIAPPFDGGRACRPATAEPNEIIHAISDLTHASAAVRKVCDEFADVLDEHLAGRRTTRGPGKELARATVPNSGWCVDSLNAALWAFNATTSFEEGLIAAVNLGGDSDSIGAIFGQIGGAYYGFDAIPRRWVKGIKTSDAVNTFIEAFISALERNAVSADFQG